MEERETQDEFSGASWAPLPGSFQTTDSKTLGMKELLRVPASLCSLVVTTILTLVSTWLSPTFAAPSVLHEVVVPPIKSLHLP